MLFLILVVMQIVGRKIRVKFINSPVAQEDLLRSHIRKPSTQKPLTIEEIVNLPTLSFIEVEDGSMWKEATLVHK